MESAFKKEHYLRQYFWNIYQQILEKFSVMEKSDQLHSVHSKTVF